MKINPAPTPVNIKPTEATSKVDSATKSASDFADIFQEQQKIFNGGGGHPEGPKDKKPA